MGNVRSILRARRKLKMFDVMSIFKLNEDAEMTDANDVYFSAISMPTSPAQDIDIADPSDDDDNDYPMRHASPNGLVIPSFPLIQYTGIEDVAMESDVEVQTKEIPRLVFSYLCSKCGFQGRTVQEANSHKDNCLCDWCLPYLCDKCGRVYSSLVQALSHRQYHEEMNDGYLCSVCGDTSLEWNVVGDYYHRCQHTPEINNESFDEQSRKRKKDSYSEVDAKKMKLSEKRAEDVNELHNDLISELHDDVNELHEDLINESLIGCQTEEESSSLPQISVESVEIQTDDKQTREMAIQTIECVTESKEIQTERTTSLSLKNLEKKTPAENTQPQIEENLSGVNSDSFSELFCLTFNRMLYEARHYFDNNCSTTTDKAGNPSTPSDAEINFYRCTTPAATATENSGGLMESHRAVLDKIADVPFPSYSENATQPQLKREVVPLRSSSRVRNSVGCKVEHNETVIVKKPRGRPRKNSVPSNAPDQFSTPSTSMSHQKNLRSASKSRAPTPVTNEENDFATIKSTPRNSKSNKRSSQKASTELIDASVFQAKRLLLPETFCNSSDDESLPEVSFL